MDVLDFFNIKNTGGGVGGIYVQSFRQHWPNIFKRKNKAKVDFVQFQCKSYLAKSRWISFNFNAKVT